MPAAKTPIVSCCDDSAKILAPELTIVGVFCSLSMGGGINLTSFMDKTFFDFMDELSSKYMLPVGGFLTAIFVLKEWSVKSFISELGHKIIGPKEDLLM